MRDLEDLGEHCPGHDEGSVGICYEGGINCFGEPAEFYPPYIKQEWR